jgi:hypothetical protein
MCLIVSLSKLGRKGFATPLPKDFWTATLSIADDVALFIRPVEDELQVTKEILNASGMASGLQTNLHKSCIIPIHCEDVSLLPVRDTLPCTVAEFPCTYLGLQQETEKNRSYAMD